MFEAIVTFVTTEEPPDQFLDPSRFYTKVFRLEFENEDDFLKWLEHAKPYVTHMSAMRDV